MINVLWSHQLEAAEQVRASQSLYVRNINALLSAGPEKLEAAAGEPTPPKYHTNHEKPYNTNNHPQS